MQRKPIYLIIVVFIFILICSISIGYSAFSTNFKISGEATVRVKSNIRITNLFLKSASNGGTETYVSQYSKDITCMYSTLPPNASIVYEVEISNNSNDDYFIEELNVNHQNSTVIYSFTGIDLNDVVYKNTKKTFTFTVTNSSDTTQEAIDIINYRFTVVANYTISYDLDGGSVSSNPSVYTQFSDTFKLNAPVKNGYTFLGWMDMQDNLYYKGTHNTSYNITIGDNYFVLNQNISGNSISSFRINLVDNSLKYVETIIMTSVEYASTVYTFNQPTGDYYLYMNANSNKSDGGIICGMHFINGEKYVVNWHKVYGTSNEWKIENLQIYRQGGYAVNFPIGTIAKGSKGNRSYKAIWS